MNGRGRMLGQGNGEHNVLDENFPWALDPFALLPSDSHPTNQAAGIVANGMIVLHDDLYPTVTSYPERLAKLRSDSLLVESRHGKINRIGFH